MIDSHCHLDFEKLAPHVEDVLLRASRAGVSQLITIGCSVPRAEQAIAIADAHEQVFAAIGVHPEECSHNGETDVDVVVPKLRDLAASSKKVVAIGETGLDYFRSGDRATSEQQKMLFRAHLDLAKELHLPVILHIREAFEEALEILAAYEGIKAVVHCFTGDLFEAKQCLERGFFLGFTGIVTFGDGSLDDVVREVLLDKILVETDAPFLAPMPYRGKTNEPAYLVKTVERIAQIRGLALIEIDEVTTANTRTLFRLPEPSLF